MNGPEDVAWLDRLPSDEALRELTACCASRRWAERVEQGRPYGTWSALLDVAVDAGRELTWADVLEALSAHPMIGQRATGDTPEAAWSRAEQAGMAGTSEQVAERLLALNLAYQEKFGHVFLICASGLPAEVMLRALEHRLRNDAAAEERATRGELVAITRLRLERLLQSAPVGAGATGATEAGATAAMAVAAGATAAGGATAGTVGATAAMAAGARSAS